MPVSDTRRSVHLDIRNEGMLRSAPAGDQELVKSNICGNHTWRNEGGKYKKSSFTWS